MRGESERERERCARLSGCLQRRQTKPARGEKQDGEQVNLSTVKGEREARKP